VSAQIIFVSYLSMPSPKDRPGATPRQALLADQLDPVPVNVVDEVHDQTTANS